jgi:hypothetical protein
MQVKLASDFSFCLFCFFDAYGKHIFCLVLDMLHVFLLKIVIKIHSWTELMKWRCPLKKIKMAERYKILKIFQKKPASQAFRLTAWLRLDQPRQGIRHAKPYDPASPQGRNDTAGEVKWSGWEELMQAAWQQGLYAGPRASLLARWD